MAKFFSRKGLNITHVYSSDLQRAFKTANAVVLAASGAAQLEQKLKVIALQLLREQDFGYYEGKPFYARSKDTNRSGKDTHRSQHQNDPDFKDVETKESMALRMTEFLEQHLLPGIYNSCDGKENAIVVVSHGIILAHLWRCFLKLLPKNSVTLAPGLSVGTGGVTPLEYLGGWSNTGYLELEIQKQSSTTSKSKAASSPASDSPDPQNKATIAPLHDYQMSIKTVNGKEHLQGLKRTRGVGSSKLDENQKPIDSFFKKRKATSDPD